MPCIKWHSRPIAALCGFQSLCGPGRATVTFSTTGQGSSRSRRGRKHWHLYRVLSNLVGPTGRVHSFEPSPDNFRRLADVASGRPNVTTNEMAVSDKTERSFFIFQTTSMSIIALIRQKARLAEPFRSKLRHLMITSCRVRVLIC